MRPLIAATAVVLLSLGATALAMEPSGPQAPIGRHLRAQDIQYDRGPDRGPNDYRDYRDQPRDRYDSRDYRGPKWRPGQVVPRPLLDRVVGDWEERGLSRPPGGHQWFRVGQQFVLVRGRDRMIARILNFVSDGRLGLAALPTPPDAARASEPVTMKSRRFILRCLPDMDCGLLQATPIPSSTSWFGEASPVYGCSEPLSSFFSD